MNYHNRDFAIILAAGFSTRMGTCKTTLPWYDRTLLSYQAEQFLLANITPIIVLGSHNAHRQTDCPARSRVVINHNSDRGKTGSILIGLDALPISFSTVIISAVDQPRPFEVYQTLLESYYQEKALIIAPCYRQKLGHPLLFSALLLPELKTIEESTFGLRKIVRKCDRELKKIEFTTTNILIDINHRSTYREEWQKTTIYNRYHC
jgi:molybdenum cofactor cytidylyltransferase